MIVRKRVVLSFERMDEIPNWLSSNPKSALSQSKVGFRTNRSLLVACAQTSPISFAPREAKEIEDVCAQATFWQQEVRSDRIKGLKDIYPA